MDDKKHPRDPRTKRFIRKPIKPDGTPVFRLTKQISEPVLGTLLNGFRIEPGDEEVVYDGTFGELADYKAPLSGVELMERGIVASERNPYEFFSPDEKIVAEFLRHRGMPIISVGRLPDYNTADAVTLDDTITTIEIKSQGSAAPATTLGHIRKAVKQSPNVVVYNTGGMSPVFAKFLIEQALLQFGKHFRNIIIRLDGDNCVYWQA